MKRDNKGRKKYMKKKGFTLIELLAVIVILAIIAVITVPKIADMISSSRQGGAEDSFYGTLKAAELGYTKALQSNTDLKGSTCNIEDSKITCTSGVKIDVSGKAPESGTLVIDSAGSTIAKALTLNGYKCYGDLSTENPCVKSDVEVASETLIKKVTTSGDGLYKDTYEEGRYVFKGQTPNNYLTFNNEIAGWRIVAVENDGMLKLIRDEKLDVNQIFDSRTNETSGRRLNSSNTYCHKWTDGEYRGCNAWSAVSGTYVNNSLKGTITEDSLMKIYLNEDYFKTLNTSAKDKIQKYNFKNGGVLGRTKFRNLKALEEKNVWNGNIALLNVSDWYKASTNSECTADTDDWYVVGKNREDYKCSLDNYLYKSDYWWWLLSPYGQNYHGVLFVHTIGYVGDASASNSSAVRPVLYLKANIQLTGTGTSSDPYKIKETN